jgi:hypothetical protein
MEEFSRYIYLSNDKRQTACNWYNGQRKQWEPFNADKDVDPSPIVLYA